MKTLLLTLTLLPAPAVALEPPPETVPVDCTATPKAFTCGLDRMVQDAAEAVKQAQPPATAKPTPAQQAVLDRIRKLRDGDTRRFGECSYRWDQWKLIANNVRTTTYSCDKSEVEGHTVGVSCGGLTINYYQPTTPLGQKPETWAWGKWRLPEAGGEEQMVAALCANAMPAPSAAPAPAKPIP